MIGLQLVSEPFSISGSVTGKTLGKAVANSPLEEAEILLRETLQNSLDARLRPDKPMRFTVSGWHATPGQRLALTDSVFAEVPPTDGRVRELLEARRDLPLLLIADCDTRGLGGPTRADLTTDEPAADFRDFFLNVGREAKKGFSGGTFGLGRGVLFELSEVGVVIAYTRTTAEGSPVRRLMAMAIGEDYEHEGRKFTGRHWWGLRIDDDMPGPVLDEEADALAAELGINVIPDNGPGTALLVVAPRLADGFELMGLVRAIQRAALLYAWPHMLHIGGGPTVHFSFLFEGTEERPLSPSAGDSPVRRFAEAYRFLCSPSEQDGATSWRTEDIQFKRGRALPEPLGKLAFRHFPPAVLAELDGHDGRIPKSCVAVMRKPRIVVKYMAMPEHPHGSDTAGVFVADPTFEGDFAASEPVAHDDWLPNKLELEKFGRNPVKQVLEKIRKAIKDSWQRDFRPMDVGNVDDVAVGLATMLGGLVAGSDGVGPPRIPTGSRAGGSSFHRRIVVDRVRLDLDGEGRRIALFDLKVKHLTGSDALRVQAKPRVLTDSGREGDDQGPVAAPLPQVLEWRAPGERVLAEGDVAELPRDVSAVTVVVLQPDDVVVALSVRDTSDDGEEST